MGVEDGIVAIIAFADLEAIAAHSSALADSLLSAMTASASADAAAAGESTEGFAALSRATLSTLRDFQSATPESFVRTMRPKVETLIEPTSAGPYAALMLTSPGLDVALMITSPGPHVILAWQAITQSRLLLGDMSEPTGGEAEAYGDEASAPPDAVARNVLPSHIPPQQALQLLRKCEREAEWMRDDISLPELALLSRALAVVNIGMGTPLLKAGEVPAFD